MHISYLVDSMLIMITYTMCHKYHVNEQWTTNEPLRILINFSYTKKNREKWWCCKRNFFKFILQFTITHLILL